MSDAMSLVAVVTVTLNLDLAVALGTLALVWSVPARLMAGAGSIASAASGAVAAVVVDNLPAAGLLGSGPLAHPRSLLIGLDIGPNLAVVDTTKPPQDTARGGFAKAEPGPTGPASWC
jgi:arsenical pump membrane protein